MNVPELCCTKLNEEVHSLAVNCLLVIKLHLFIDVSNCLIVFFQGLIQFLVNENDFGENSVTQV